MTGKGIGSMISERLIQQIDFIREVDKIKNIFRQTKIYDGTRRENDAEHSWHMALMAMLLYEHSKDKDINLLRIMKMAIIHDLVEIDAGDTFCYDNHGNLDKKEREEKAADRLFGMLPKDQGNDFMQMWIEFDDMKTPDAKFAAALDRLQPVLLNILNKGGTWNEHGITKKQVIERNKHIAAGSPELWEFTEALIEDAIKKGYLKE